jgi:uncharacterized membrane protein YcjF (UPF0283 family)
VSDGLQIFDEPADPGSGDLEAVESDHHSDEHAKKRPRWPGAFAGGVAILMVLTWAIGLVSLTNGLFELGVGLSISAVLLSGIAVVGGVVAIIGNWGRGWGIAAAGVGVLLNPVVLTYILGSVGVL